MTTRDQNGNTLFSKVRQEPDGTWSRLVWFGGALGPATDVRRVSGYLSKTAALAGDISETPIQTNRRIHPERTTPSVSGEDLFWGRHCTEPVGPFQKRRTA
jgi:hypothetical protein